MQNLVTIKPKAIPKYLKFPSINSRSFYFQFLVIKICTLTHAPGCAGISLFIHYYKYLSQMGQHKRTVFFFHVFRPILGEGGRHSQRLLGNTFARLGLLITHMIFTCKLNGSLTSLIWE